MRSGNFNASHSSLAAIESDLYTRDLLQSRQDKRGELLWDGSRDRFKPFPKDKKKPLRNVSTVYVRSNKRHPASGGKVYSITKRALDTSHLIKRRQRKAQKNVSASAPMAMALTPVKYVDEDVIQRRQVGQHRMTEIVQKMVLPIEAAYRRLMRLLRTSRLRVAQHPDVITMIYDITNTVKEMRKRREQPIDLSSNKNIVRHLRMVVDFATKADELMNEAIELVEAVQDQQLQLYHERMVRKSVWRDHGLVFEGKST